MSRNRRLWKNIFKIVIAKSNKKMILIICFHRYYLIKFRLRKTIIVACSFSINLSVRKSLVEMNNSSNKNKTLNNKIKCVKMDSNSIRNKQINQKNKIKLKISTNNCCNTLAMKKNINSNKMIRIFNSLFWTLPSRTMWSKNMSNSDLF